MSIQFQPVAPVRPVAPYIGGKRNLAKRLVEIIETTPHGVYAEAFVGMGGVFLRRRSRPACEVINDWSRDVSTFWRVLEEHYAYFIDYLKFKLTTRDGFDRLVKVDPETLTDLQRAARFFYLQRVAFGGKVNGRNFGMDLRGARFDMTKLGPMLEDLHLRMARVTIERLPWRRFVERYDSAGTLIYLDPPYWGCEDDYGAGMFGRDEFAEMAEVLRSLKGRFILSINDRPEIRALFDGFAIEAVGVAYGICAGGATQARELIITGGG